MDASVPKRASSSCSYDGTLRSTPENRRGAFQFGLNHGKTSESYSPSTAILTSGPPETVFDFWCRVSVPRPPSGPNKRTSLSSFQGLSPPSRAVGSGEITPALQNMVRIWFPLQISALPPLFRSAERNFIILALDPNSGRVPKSSLPVAQ
jgi:hypothetical protein